MLNRMLAYGILIYLIALAGLATLNGGVLALILPLLVLLAATLYYGPAQPDLTLRRSLSADRATQEKPVKITLTVTNNSQRLELVKINDAPPPKLEIVDGETELVTTLEQGETATLTYYLRGQRGRYQFAPVEIQVSELFGLFRRQVTIDAPGFLDLFVYPKVQRLDNVPIRPRQTKAYAGPIPARLGGSGVDFFGVRTYQRGDSLRHINWRANARHPGTFFSNEFELERVADVGIILDARQRSHVEIGGVSLFEYSIQAAATLSQTFLNSGNRVALLRYGDFLDWTVPGYGRLQQERILQALAKAQTGDSLVFDQLENLPTRLFPAKSQIVLVSPLLPDDADFLPRMRAHGYSVLVITPDPVDFELSLIKETAATETAVRIARLERELLLRRLRQVGIQVFSWDVTVPFAQAIGAALPLIRPVADHNLAIIR